MIRIVAELLPGGSTAFRRTIGTMHIANVSELAPRSDYEAVVRESHNWLTRTKRRSCTVVVRDHDRHQSVWQLVAAVIAAMEGAEFEDI